MFSSCMLQSSEHIDNTIDAVADYEHLGDRSEGDLEDAKTMSTSESQTGGPRYKVQDVVVRMRGTYSSAYTSSIRLWTGIKSKSLF